RRRKPPRHRPNSEASPQLAAREPVAEPPRDGIFSSFSSNLRISRRILSRSRCLTNFKHSNARVLPLGGGRSAKHPDRSTSVVRSIHAHHASCPAYPPAARRNAGARGSAHHARPRRLCHRIQGEV